MNPWMPVLRIASPTRRKNPRVSSAAALAIGMAASGAILAATPPAKFPLDSMTGLKLVNVKGGTATHRGRRAVRLVDEPGGGEPASAAAGATRRMSDGA